MPLQSARAPIPLTPEPLFAALREAAIAHGCDLYVVGGYVRDALMGRSQLDIDVITTELPFELGKDLARRLGGHFVVLDADFGVGRLVLDEDRVVDLARLQAETVEGDLARRDLTVNAIALPLVRNGRPVESPELLDPTGGLADLEARVIRAVSVANLLADPVRLLRVLRFAATLDFRIDLETLGWVETFKRKLLDAPSERTVAELLKILSMREAYPWIERLFGLGVLGMLVPEFAMLQRIPPEEGEPLAGNAKALETARQFEVLLTTLSERFPQSASAIRRHLDSSLGAGARQGDLAKLAALLLEIGKPFCRTYDADGAQSFEGYEAEGASRIEAIADRLKLSAKAKEFLSTLVSEQPRARDLLATPRDPVALYRLFRAAGESTVGLLLLVLAQRRATACQCVAEDEDAARIIVDAYFRPDRAYTAPQRLVDGKELMQALGLKPGKQVGVLLEGILEAQLRDQVRSKDEAIAWAAARAPHLDPKT